MWNARDKPTTSWGRVRLWWAYLMNNLWQYILTQDWKRIIVKIPWWDLNLTSWAGRNWISTAWNWRIQPNQ
jgi:hypothetical protein